MSGQGVGDFGACGEYWIRLSVKPKLRLGEVLDYFVDKTIYILLTPGRRVFSSLAFWPLAGGPVLAGSASLNPWLVLTYSLLRNLQTANVTCFSRARTGGTGWQDPPEEVSGVWAGLSLAGGHFMICSCILRNTATCT